MLRWPTNTPFTVHCAKHRQSATLLTPKRPSSDFLFLDLVVSFERSQSAQSEPKTKMREQTDPGLCPRARPNPSAVGSAEFESERTPHSISIIAHCIELVVAVPFDPRHRRTDQINAKSHGHSTNIAVSERLRTLFLSAINPNGAALCRSASSLDFSLSVLLRFGMSFEAEPNTKSPAHCSRSR